MSGASVSPEALAFRLKGDMGIIFIAPKVNKKQEPVAVVECLDSRV
jgi:hypothetical protein